MKITQRLKIMLKGMLDIKMGEIATDKATLVFDGDELEVGKEVFVIGEDGEPIPAEDGEYAADEKVIVVKDGVVAEIKEAEAENAPENVEEEGAAEQKMADENEAPAPADEPETEEGEEPKEEDRIAALEAKVQEIVDAMNQIVNSIAAIEGRVAEVEGKLAKVEAPQAEPVDDEPINEKEQPKTKLSLMRKTK